MTGTWRTASDYSVDDALAEQMLEHVVNPRPRLRGEVIRAINDDNCADMAAAAVILLIATRLRDLGYPDAAARIEAS